MIVVNHILFLLVKQIIQLRDLKSLQSAIKSAKNIAGNNLNDDNTTYALFIKSEIMKYNLQNNIQFLGVISEEIMCEYYKKCNVFVSPSVIENSPNSICEAAMIGIPIVASYVGGVPSLITHEEEGYLYSSDEFYMMAHYVCEIFENKSKICERVSKNSVQKMLKINDINTNSEKNLEIYRMILEKNWIIKDK